MGVSSVIRTLTESQPSVEASASAITFIGRPERWFARRRRANACDWVSASFAIRMLQPARLLGDEEGSERRRSPRHTRGL